MKYVFLIAITAIFWVTVRGRPNYQIGEEFDFDSEYLHRNRRNAHPSACWPIRRKFDDSLKASYRQRPFYAGSGKQYATVPPGPPLPAGPITEPQTEWQKFLSQSNDPNYPDIDVRSKF